MADIGVRVQGARSAADISQAVASNAEAAAPSQTGVNLDEEAARLIQFQQSYQAAAKVLQVAQIVFDTLLQTATALTESQSHVCASPPPKPSTPASSACSSASASWPTRRSG